MSGPTAQEQLFLELINEARLDPMRNASRYLTSYTPLRSNDPEIQAALDFFKVGGTELLAAFQALTPVDPLAWNANLASAAEKHTAQMIAADEQSHQVDGEAGLGDRIRAEGYIFQRAGENVYAFAENILYGHAGFMVDWGIGPAGMQSPAGHRVNIMSANFSEVGIDVTAENNAGTQVGPLLVTEDFGDRGLTFLVGVAYTDSDRNQFYSIGEGRGDLQVRVGQASTVTAASGGYSLAITAGLNTFSFSGGGLAGTVNVKATVRSENIKIDIVDGTTLLTSASAEVEGAVSTIRGLGVVGLSLTAGTGSQRLVGTSGGDTLNSGAGDDELIGGAGNDGIDGGAGRDVAIFDRNFSHYTISALTDGRLGIASADSGSDTLVNVEVLRFSDGDKFWNASQGKLADRANAAPTVSPDQSLTTFQGVEKQITVSASDADNDPLTYTASAARHGAVTGGTGGIFTYQPASGYLGSDSFMVTITDGNGGTAVQTVNVNVQAPLAANSAPVADKILRITASEDTPRQIKIFATDDDGDPLTYRASIQPSHGTLTGGQDGLFWYTPDANYAGLDSFSVTIADGRGGTATQALELWIYDKNDVPTVDPTQTLSTRPGASKQFTVAASDAENDPLTFTTSRPANGTLTPNGTGNFIYTPDFGFTGQDSFTITVSDGKGGSSLQVVTMDVTNNPQNARPTVTSTQTVATDEDTAKQVTVTGRDSDGDALTYSAGAAGHGTVTGGTNGLFTYTPTANYNGKDSFVVTVSDGKGGTSTQTVTVNIAPVNDAPKLNATQSVTTNRNTSKTITVAATDADGDVLTYVAGTAAHGKITGTNGSFTYTPDNNYTGTDLFYVAVNDGKGGTASQAITVTIGSTNPPSQSDVPAFRLFAGDGFEGAVGGTGTVYGTQGFQEIVLDGRPGSITFDGSFNRGGDVLRIAGNAADFGASVDGSTVVLVGGGRSYTIPYGANGTKLVFDDGIRTLVFTGGNVKLGNQVIDGSPDPLQAPAETGILPDGSDAGATARAFLVENGQIAVGGNQEVFGTSKSEVVTYLFGDLKLDASFNKGGDTLILPEPLSAFKAYTSGMSIILLSDLGEIIIPVGVNGMVLNFGGEQHTLRFDVGSSSIKIGDAPITATSEATAMQLGGSNGGGGGGGDAITLDGQGNPTSESGFVTLDAGTAANTYAEGEGGNNVVIRNFGEDDVIVLTDVGDFDDYSFTSGTGADQTDLIISFQTPAGVLSIITLDDVLTSTQVFNHSTAANSVGFDFMTLG